MRSMDLFRVIVTAQLKWDPATSSNKGAFSQILRKTSCKTSSAARGSFSMQTARE